MELAVSAVTAIGQGVGSLLGIGGGAAASSGGLGLAQTLTSVLSAIGTVGAGVAGAQASRDEADQADLQSGQEQVQDLQRQTKMKRTLLQVLGENDVAFASAGIDISGGIAQQSRQTASQRAVDELTIDRRDSDFRRALLKMRAQGLRRKASSQIGGALIGAATGVLNTGIDLAGRGSGAAADGDPWAGLRVAS